MLLLWFGVTDHRHDGRLNLNAIPVMYKSSTKIARERNAWNGIDI